MNHGIALRKLGFYPSYRKSVLRNLATSLILNGRIETTEARAKEVRRIVDKLITKAKDDNLNTRRYAHSVLFDKEAVYKLFELAKEYKDRPGGYTRILKLAKFRRGDGTPLVIIELVKE
ncbi:MAG: 50S ribosomal protein L17 [Caldisericum sp.]|jgi:large subunit ribosomal protein L17|uniref:Large ribosomal subunit protein bL17 n=1 Tax=Caldisericum exile TaxID=693075 RepID=A0A7C4XTZ8_9BACT|nr:50S ribosomal protein L17 [Caldisericum sp.]